MSQISWLNEQYVPLTLLIHLCFLLPHKETSSTECREDDSIPELLVSLPQWLFCQENDLVIHSALEASGLTLCLLPAQICMKSTARPCSPLRALFDWVAFILT